MGLTLWSRGGSVLDVGSGVEIRVEGNTALGRKSNGTWEEIDGFTGIFAPGGDLWSG